MPPRLRRCLIRTAVRSGRLPGPFPRRILMLALHRFQAFRSQIEEPPCGTKSKLSPPSRSPERAPRFSHFLCLCAPGFAVAADAIRRRRRAPGSRRQENQNREGHQRRRHRYQSSYRPGNQGLNVGSAPTSDSQAPNAAEVKTDLKADESQLAAETTATVKPGEDPAIAKRAGSTRRSRRETGFAEARERARPRHIFFEAELHDRSRTANRSSTRSRLRLTISKR